VENEDETRCRLKEASAEYNFTVDRPDFYEEKYKGPDAVMIDISGRSWVGAEPPFSVPDRVEKRT
jgi:hypothetical protein